MASLSLYSQFESNLMSNHKVIELLLQLKSAKAHGKNYIKVKPHLDRHLLRNRLFWACNDFTEYAGILRCNFPCNLSCNVGKRNPLQVAEVMLYVAISDCNLQWF